MRTLRVAEVLSDLPTFAAEHGLRLPKAGSTYAIGKERGGGGFGEVWMAKPAEAAPGDAALVVKTVSEPHSLADSVFELQQALERRADSEWAQTLLASPFSIVIAELDGERREAIFMLDLAERGYVELKDQFGEAAPKYQARPVHERVELAHSYACGATLLESIRLIHGDQNLPNLMFNPGALDVQIIDLDAGAVATTGGERAIAEGKQDNCIPPEARNPGPGGALVDKSPWDLEAERWSVGILVGQLAFGLDPSIFLKSSARVFGAYAREGPWPRINVASPLFNEGAAAAYEYWLPRLEAAPGRLVETFGRFFRAGTKGSERPTAQDWVDALEAARQKPKFISLRVTPTVAPEGTEVTIAWEAEGADRVEHRVLGELAASGEATMVLERSGRQTFTAVNYYGQVDATTEVLRAVPLPKLTSVPIPAFPGLELRTRVATGLPPRPTPVSPPFLPKGRAIPPVTPMVGRGPRLSAGLPYFGQLYRRPPARTLEPREEKG